MNAKVKSKLLCRYDQAWMAERLLAELSKHHIKYQVISCPREYASVILGGGQDKIEIFVSEYDFNEALKLYNKLNLTLVTTEVTSESASYELKNSDRSYFKKIIFFSFLGALLLPIVFNWVATINYRALRKQSTSLNMNNIALFVLICGWIVAVVEVIMIFTLYI